MDFLDLIKSRFSARKFLDKEIEEDKLNLIMESGRMSPTAKNNQPQLIYVIKSKESLEKIDSITPCRYNAPVVLMICADTSKAWQSPYEDGYTSSEMDCSIVTTQMMLMSKSLGLDSCWLLMFDKEKAIKEFNLPDNIKPICLLDIGYSDSVPSPNHTNKKNLNEMFKII